MISEERLLEIGKRINDILVEKRKIEIGDRVYIWNMLNLTMEGKLFTISKEDYDNKKEYIVIENNVEYQKAISNIGIIVNFDLVLYDTETKKQFRSSKLNVHICDGTEKILPMEIDILTEEEKKYIEEVTKPKPNPLMN